MTSPSTAEVIRLRQILWEIARMCGGDTGAAKNAPKPGKIDPDVPELARLIVEQFVADVADRTGETPSFHPDAVNPRIIAMDMCTCGWPIVYTDGWGHVFDGELTGTDGDGHDLEPATGYYEPRRPRRRQPAIVLQDEAAQLSSGTYTVRRSEGTFTMPVNWEPTAAYSRGGIVAEPVNVGQATEAMNDMLQYMVRRHAPEPDPRENDG